MSAKRQLESIQRQTENRVHASRGDLGQILTAESDGVWAALSMLAKEIDEAKADTTT